MLIDALVVSKVKDSFVVEQLPRASIHGFIGQYLLGIRTVRVEAEREGVLDARTAQGGLAFFLYLVEPPVALHQ